MKAIVSLFLILVNASLFAQIASAEIKQQCLEKVLNHGDHESLMEKASRNFVISNLKALMGKHATNVRIKHVDFNRFVFEENLEIWKASKIEIEGYIRKKNGDIVDFKSEAKRPNFVVEFLRNIFGEVEGCSILINDFHSWRVVNAESDLDILTLSKDGEVRNFKFDL